MSPLSKFKNAYLQAEKGVEIWTNIKGHPQYQISNFGRLVSYYGKTPKIISPNINATKHRSYKLHKSGEVFTYPAHRLVLINFGEPCDLHVLHLDDDPSNNSICNLMFGTQQVNIDLCIAHGRKPIGEKSVASTITESQAKEVIHLYSKGFSDSDVAQKLDISLSVVKHIVFGKTWSHLDKSSINQRSKPLPNGLTEIDIRDIRKFRKSGYQAQVLEKMYGLSGGTVTRIAKRQIHAWVED